MRQEPITFACMTQDRVENLKILLPKVLPYVDRAIIIDGSPEGPTKDYCESLCPKVMWKHRKWDDNFANQWNEYLKYVNGGWILILDDDEVLSEDGLDSLDYFVNASNYGENFCFVEFRSHDISEGVPAERPAEYWRQIFFRYNKNLHYRGGTKTGCHQYVVGYQNGRGVRSDFVYYHSKSLKDEHKNAARNYFIYGIWRHGSTDGDQREEWHELKSILSRVLPEVKVFPDLEKVMKEGRLPQEVKDWMIKWYRKVGDDPDYNEMKALVKFYYRYLHPEEDNKGIF